MGAILKLLSGSAGGWIFGGALLAAALFGAAGGSFLAHRLDALTAANLRTDVANAQGETKQCKLTAETGRANGNQKVIDALSAGTADLTAALGALDAAEADRKTADAKFLKELSNAPHTTICGTSPAERAYRDSLRPQPGAAAP